MSDRTQVRPLQIEPREVPVSRVMYHQLEAAGHYARRRVELFRGKVIEMPAIGTDHGRSSLKSAKQLRRLFPEDRFTVRPGLPFIAVDDSEPEPDLCVVPVTAEASTEHPSTCLLLIEVSEATLAFDRDGKLKLYAESGVADYWIVNLIDRQIEVYRHPHQIADGTWSYDAPVIRKPGETVDLLALPGATLAVDDLLP
ncbi:MAG: Uma2 family endonuclease [Tepidisphaeraceae bacterium]